MRKPGQHQHQHQATCVRASDYAKHAGSFGGDAAGEIARTPHGGSSQTKGSTGKSTEIHRRAGRDKIETAIPGRRSHPWAAVKSAAIQQALFNTSETA